MIDFVNPKNKQLLVREANELKSLDGSVFKIVNDIPRFVALENYADAFGFQWKNFAKTQLDSFTKNSISEERMVRSFGFPLSNLKGKTVLEVGCGAGRFTEILVKHGALTHSIDLSNAVEVNKENIGKVENYSIAQASVYELPFPKNSFDYVMCLGVIQHTPSSEKTISSLYEMLKPEGLLVIDHYIWRIGYYFNPATYWRLILKELKPTTSKIIVDKLAAIFFPLHWAFRNIKPLDWLVKRVSPIMTYMAHFPFLTRSEHYELSRLDSYDSLTDYYKHLRTPAQIKLTLENLGATNIFIDKDGNGVEARCNKPIQ